MDKLQALVRRFHREVLNMPTSPAEPMIRFGDLRATLIAEEAIETVMALVGNDVGQTIVHAQMLKVLQDRARENKVGPNLLDAIDGCIDTKVVIDGTLESIGVDGEPFAEEVMRANMAKKGGPVREDGKMLKPPGWTPPDIAGVLARIRERMTMYKVGERVFVRKTCRRGCCVENEFYGTIDEIDFQDDGTPHGVWVMTEDGHRTYGHFSAAEKGVVEQ